MGFNNPYFNEIREERLELIDSIEINNTIYLSYVLHSKDTLICPKCQSTQIIKYGKGTRKLKARILAHFKTNISVEVSKFKCNRCSTYFYDHFEDVETNCNISKNTILSVLQDLRSDLTIKYVAQKNSIDEKTVINIFEKYINIERLTLPSTICVDEFKNLKNEKGKYAFVIYSPTTQEIVDILPNRQQDKLIKYFSEIDYQERASVKYFIQDMNSSYFTIAKQFFPNATIVVDSFHYIECITKAFGDIRLRIQEKIKENRTKYNMLKKNWRLLTKQTRNIPLCEIYNYMRRRKTSPSNYLNDALSISEELAMAYDTLQDFYVEWENVKLETADEFMDRWINIFENHICEEYHGVASTFKHWRNEIINSFIRFGDKRLSNGPIEGINNKIKAIKKISYGYKNFELMRSRIMYIINKKINCKKI